MLSERLDHHRNQGKQQIVVQHTTTVNANQAVVTDSVVTGKKNEAAPSAKLVAAVTDKPIEIIARHRGHRASGRPASPAPQAHDKAHPSVLMLLCTGAHREPFAWG